ncbi:PREDICTED: A disintegrin and metalloproteinase with thrombospondin motifs 15 [Nanorana parkeri]|uniref:A disintegrin and metalloproteinase with thrombospondin motifs 15 n=1 Tax=Nanorana parkeri TaxID=125878 RepID=UPI000854160F|nr:PREDICTED: A disintegrin and metalloproteinase with thrombospondin motifs 15 [Nanorana parkeri]
MRAQLAVTSLLTLDLLFLSPSLYAWSDKVMVTPQKLDPDINGRQYYKEGRGRAKDRGVIFQISAFQEDFYLNLSPDSQFIAPAFSMHFPGTAPKPSPSLRHCFYSGDVNSHRDSFAALSLCGGLRGAFGYRGVEYSISPLKNGTWDQLQVGHQGLHLLQRSRALLQAADTTSRCGVGSGLNHGIMEALQRYKSSKHGKHQINGTRRGGHRSRRFASITRYVETLIVADETMLKFHGEDLQHYLLTLMATAARLYRHPGIQNPINIVVVKFMVLTDDGKGPKVTTNAAMTLRSFCAWQKKWNKVSDKHPEYWDTAILFTKTDLCGASTCDTLGMADVGTMCDPKRSCSVIEDDGLPSAFTTAHELGHVFNMPHDNVKACEEVFGKLKENHMMSPTLIQIDRANPWSGCSAAIITDFLDSGHGECLLDEPAKPITLPDELAGGRYSLGRQCELAFGLGSKPCPYMQYCTKLWCTGRARGQLVCQTRHFPWADGTSCGEGRFCLNGECVEKHNTTRHQVSIWVCPCVWRSPFRCSVILLLCVPGKGFREEQCEAFNGYNQSTNRLTSAVGWVPKYSGVSPRDKCKLICRANGTGYFYVLAPKVGTLLDPIH